MVQAPEVQKAEHRLHSYSYISFASLDFQGHPRREIRKDDVTRVAQRQSPANAKAAVFTLLPEWIDLAARWLLYSTDRPRMEMLGLSSDTSPP